MNKEESKLRQKKKQQHSFKSLVFLFGTNIQKS